MKLSVDRVYYRCNEHRLKPAALEYARHLPRSEQLKGFKEYISESWGRESEDYRGQMVAKRDEIYAAELKAHKNRKNWDASTDAMNE